MFRLGGKSTHPGGTGMRLAGKRPRVINAKQRTQGVRGRREKWLSLGGQLGTPYSTTMRVRCKVLPRRTSTTYTPACKATAKGSLRPSVDMTKGC